MKLCTFKVWEVKWTSKGDWEGIANQIGETRVKKPSEGSVSRRSECSYMSENWAFAIIFNTIEAIGSIAVGQQSENLMKVDLRKTRELEIAKIVDNSSEKFSWKGEPKNGTATEVKVESKVVWQKTWKKYLFLMRIIWKRRKNLGARRAQWRGVLEKEREFEI